MIRDTSHLLDIIDTINEKGVHDETILVSFDIVNIFASINNVKVMKAVRLALNIKVSNKTSTKCVLEGMQIYLYNNNSVFDKNHLLQKIAIETDASNSCSYFGIANNRLDQVIEQE